MNTPSIGVTVYKVHSNKDGSRWIKGDSIAKYWFDRISDAPNRLFLDEEIIKMSLDKAIEHGKEKRKPYYGAQAIDCTCRPHGSCEWCRSNRMY